MKGPVRRSRSPSASVVKLKGDVDEGEAVGGAGWIVGADRAVAAVAAAALPLSGSQPGRPRPDGQQAPPTRRRRRHPARLDAHRRQPNDVTQLLELLDRVPPVRGRVGRPRRRPRTLIADRGYDHDKYRRLVWKRGVKPVVARRQTEHGSGLGRHRWVVERTFAWLHNRRRLLIRTDRRDDIHQGFLALACCLICWRRLETSFS